MGAILGGSNSATRQAQQAAAMQRISNERVLATQQAEASRTGTSRRVPKGRRLFVNDTSEKTDLS